MANLLIRGATVLTMEDQDGIYPEVKLPCRGYHRCGGPAGLYRKTFRRTAL